MGLYRSTGYSLKSNVAGDFHRPYETQKFFTFHRSTKKPLDSGGNMC